MLFDALGRGLTYNPGPSGRRFTNYDRKGSNLPLHDDLRLLRRHTYTILPNGHMVKVPAALKQKVCTLRSA